MNVSPSEEMPPRPTQVPAIPGSWAIASPPREAPLFGPAQVAQLRRAQQEHPLYGVPQITGQGSEGDSERSSRLQAEVQRQLEEYQSRQQVEMERLQREIVRLREERDMERRMRQGQSGGDLPQSQNVPEGNQGPLSLVHGLPQSQNVPEGNHGPLPVQTSLHGSLGVPQSQNVPEGNHGPLPVQASLHGSLRIPQSQDVPEGNHGPLPSSLMPRRSYAGQGTNGLEQSGGVVSDEQIQHNGKAISSKPPAGPMVSREPCQNKEMPIDSLECRVFSMDRCHLLRVRTYQEGITVLYLRVRTYEEGITVLYNTPESERTRRESRSSTSVSERTRWESR